MSDDRKFYPYFWMPISSYATVASAWLCIYNMHDNTVEDLVEYYEDAVRYGIVFG